MIPLSPAGTGKDTSRVKVMRDSTPHLSHLYTFQLLISSPSLSQDRASPAPSKSAGGARHSIYRCSPSRTPA